MYAAVDRQALTEQQEVLERYDSNVRPLRKVLHRSMSFTCTRPHVLAKNCKQQSSDVVLGSRNAEFLRLQLLDWSAQYIDRYPQQEAATSQHDQIRSSYISSSHTRQPSGSLADFNAILRRVTIAWQSGVLSCPGTAVCFAFHPARNARELLFIPKLHLQAHNGPPIAFR